MGIKAGTLEIDFIVDLVRLKRDMDAATGTVGSSTGVIAARVDNANRALTRFTGGMTNLNKSSGAARAGLQNLSFQLNDVVVGLASGQKPFTVFIQQGAQILQIAQQAEGGIRGFSKEVAGLALRFAPVIAAAGVLAVGFERWQASLNDDAGIKKFVSGLDLTDKELRKLKDQSVTVSDTLSGLWKTVSDGLDLGGGSKRLLDFLFAPGDLQQLGNFAGQIVGLMSGTYRSVIDIWRGFPNALSDLVYQAANGVIAGTEALINGVIDRINRFTRGANGIFGSDFGALSHVELGRLKNQYAGSAKDLGDSIVNNFAGSFGRGQKAVSDFFATVGKNAVQAAKDRLKTQADLLSADRRAAEAEKARKKSLEEMAKAAREAAAAHKALMETFDAILAKFDPVTAALREYSKVLDQIEKLRKGGLIDDRTAVGFQIQAAPDLNKIKADAEASARLIKFEPDLSGLQVVADRIGDIQTGAQQLNDALAKQVNHWRDIRDSISDAAGSFERAFGNVGRGITAAIDGVLFYGQQQAKAEKARQANLELAGKDAGKQAEAQKQYARDMALSQVTAYGDILEASRDFFGKNSKGYEALTKGVQAFRAVEFALSVRSIAQDAAHTASSLANSAARTAAGAVEAVVNAIKSLPFPLNLAAGAATAAAIASLGVSIAGSFGGGGSKPAPANEGKGTVLGDGDAQSQSLTRAIQALQDIDTLTLNVSRDMLTSLRAIETNIGGLSSLIVRTGDVNASAGVKTGFKSDALGSTLSTILTGGGLLSGVPIIGDILGGIGGVIKSLFGSKTTVTGSGIFGGGQTLADILGGGFDASYYSDVQKKKKFFGITTGTSYSTQFTDASDEIEDQFTQILSGFYKAIQAASGPLGVATNDIQKRLDSFVVNIGKIDLQGLTGEEIDDKLTAVFGAAADNIAKAAIPGLERFQKVGEGYFETVARVASTVDALSQSFGRLGANAQNLSVDAAVNLSDIFGSASDAASAANAFFEAYYTEAEQTAAKTAQLGKVFESLGLTMPDTLASFRALVEAQDLTTAAGQQTYATLLQLAPAFADLQGAMQDAASAAAILRERQDLERQLLELQGNTTALRALDLSRLDASNRALQEQIYALQDQQAAAQAAAAAADQAAQAEQALASQRLGLEGQILQLTGDTAEIRRRELAALDPSLRALQQRIYDLQDEQAAQQAAAQAAQDAAQKAQQLADAWKGVGDSILDEINRIRGVAANDNDNFASLQAQFNAASIAARAGDQGAGGKLTGLSQSLLDAAAKVATSRQELERIQNATAASLAATYAAISAAVGNSNAATKGFGSNGAAPASDAVEWWSTFASSAPSASSDNAELLAEVKALRTEVAQLRKDNNSGHANTASKVGKIDDQLDQLTGPNGGAALTVKAAA